MFYNYSEEEKIWIEKFVPILRSLAKRINPEIDNDAWFLPINWEGTSKAKEFPQCAKSFCRICRQYFTFSNVIDYIAFTIEHGTEHLKERNLLPFL